METEQYQHVPGGFDLSVGAAGAGSGMNQLLVASGVAVVVAIASFLVTTGLLLAFLNYWG